MQILFLINRYFNQDTEDRWESNKKHNSSVLSKKKNRKIKTPNVRRDSVNSEG